MKRATIVSHILTGAKDTFYNGLNLKENLVSSIILMRNEGSNLLNDVTRAKYMQDVELIPTKTGSQRAYSQEFDLVAYHEGEENNCINNLTNI